jgi:hypothetical protein
MVLAPLGNAGGSQADGRLLVKEHVQISPRCVAGRLRMARARYIHPDIAAM